jgi:hypothetical protein
MKSNVCKIENGSLDLGLILKESEKVAIYNEFDSKQTLQLRLLCEEIDGLLPNVIDEFEGEFWIEYENGVCKINLAIQFEEFTADKKKELINIAKNKKNASVKGILGKIRSGLEDLFLDCNVNKSCDMAWAFNYANECCVGMNYSYAWSLKQYKQDVKQDEWDELEKSIITSVADDVIVGVKGRKASIIIAKKFV